ncbi:MAG: diaminobutyrate--2-oxoglutarate transaminase [Acidobacteriota bacterium]|nr:diaminobutyrate--2-oxoglutarate transaminase [Acidobacteriota bacterium]
MSLEIFDRLESEVRGYCRMFPDLFERAAGARLYTHDGREYLDFFSGAGALSYGHNHPRIQRALIDYLEAGGVTHALDMSTVAKRDFIRTFEAVILQPRGLDYKVQFPGPTGTNAVEAALKLARKVTGRSNVLCFTNGYHGMTLGALAVTGNSTNRAAAGVALGNTVAMPFDGYFGHGIDTLEYLETYLQDASSGLDKPAAAILETVQAEGGVHPASWDWLRRLAVLLAKHRILLIVDDIQAGCGRTGPFFSFEPAGIVPDIVCLSKSISGYGLPMALVLMRRELDCWKPGEHNGTFRGFNLAFVGARAALDFWRGEELQKAVEAAAEIVRRRLALIHRRYTEACGPPRGRGLLQGIPCTPAEVAGRVSRAAFERGLVVETCGAEEQVVKLLPPLTIDEPSLEMGLEILDTAFSDVLGADGEAGGSRSAAGPSPKGSPPEDGA